jgi:glutaredoxin
MAKQYLSSKNVVFQNIDVSQDQNAAQEMVKKSGQMGVPVLDIDGQLVIGFDRQRIDALLINT